MTPRALVEQRPFPIGAVLLLLLAAFCVLIGVAEKSNDWGVFGVLPAVLGVMLLIGRPGIFQAQLTPSEIVVQSSGEAIPYKHIQRISFTGMGRNADRGRVYIAHSQGLLRIPEVEGMSGAELFCALAEITPSPAIVYHQSVGDFLRSHVDTFGADRVWPHAARPFAKVSQHRQAVFVCFGLLAVAVIWFIAGAMLNQPAWSIAAVFAVVAIPFAWMLSSVLSNESTYSGNQSGVLIVSLLFGPFWVLAFAASQSGTTRRLKKLRESSLVISPVGLALAQGDLIGQLKWAEVKKVRLKTGSLFSRPTLHLNVEGARIEVQDIYDAPLSEIHRQVLHYWQAG